jgi:hypothetical protein
MILACQPKEGPDRFLGTFRWRLRFGYQAVTFERNGKATYVMVMPGEGDEDPPETESYPSTYHVQGDTAFTVVEWPESEGGRETLAMLLQGDTLVMLNPILGQYPLFIREK